MHRFPVLRTASSRAIRWAGLPVVQGAGLLVAAGLVLVVALERFERHDQAAGDRDMEALSAFNWKPATHPAAAHATTDAGRPLPVYDPQELRDAPVVDEAERVVLTSMNLTGRVIRKAPASDACNCHGWVFTGGRFWIDGHDVPRILSENGYHAVTNPRAGDLAIYRDGELVIHTAVVGVAADGLLLIDGKWGWMGVFRHRPDGSCYGKDVTYYRSARAGHVLAGLGGSPSTTDVAAVVGQ